MMKNFYQQQSDLINVKEENKILQKKYNLLLEEIKNLKSEQTRKLDEINQMHENEINSLKNEMKKTFGEIMKSIELKDEKIRNQDLLIQKVINDNEEIKNKFIPIEEEFRKRQDRTIQQCNDFIREVFTMIDQGNPRDFALPLKDEEREEVLESVKDYRNQYIKAQKLNEKIVEEAANLGYESKDVAGAIQHISRYVTEGVHNAEVDYLHKTMTDITSASDKIKQNNKELVDRYRKKFQEASRRIDHLEEVINQLINFKTENDENDLDFLRENLTEDQLEQLQIPAKEEND